MFAFRWVIYYDGYALIAQKMQRGARKNRRNPMKCPLSYVRVALVSLVMATSLPTFAADSPESCPKQVNINTADEHQLATCVHSVGEKTAAAIVAYRTEHGNFKSVDDIASVKGVGKTRAEKLAPQLTVG